MSLASILTLLTAILGLYSNPQIAQNVQLKSQVDALAGQAIAAAEQALAQPQTTQSGAVPSSGNLSVNVPPPSASSTPIVVNITPAQPAVSAPAAMTTPAPTQIVPYLTEWAQISLDGGDTWISWDDNQKGIIYNDQTTPITKSGAMDYIAMSNSQGDTILNDQVLQGRITFWCGGGDCVGKTDANGKDEGDFPTAANATLSIDVHLLHLGGGYTDTSSQVTADANGRFSFSLPGRPQVSTSTGMSLTQEQAAQVNAYDVIIKNAGTVIANFRAYVPFEVEKNEAPTE